MKKILIVAGDSSGDLMASQLVQSMRKIHPEISVAGCGGKYLEKVCDRYLGDLVQTHTFGFAISPQKIRYFHQFLSRIILPELKENSPDIVIPVDFYGFNCRVAMAAKKNGAQVCYYISPQFWASRPGRAEKLRPFVDLFLCLFPFEMEFYKARNIPAQFVGHPLLDQIPVVTIDQPPPARVELNVGLLPGSRLCEIHRHLPVIMEACQKIHAEVPSVRFVLFTVPHVLRQTYDKILSRYGRSTMLIDLVEDEGYRWRSQMDLAITSSGLETFENALLGIPMVIMYKMNWFNYLIARLLINTPLVGLPNILAGKEIVPELIQWEATPSKIARIILDWIQNPLKKRQVRSQLLNLRGQFGEQGASERAARAIIDSRPAC